MANVESPLAQLLQDELKDLYDAEKQLTRALPKLAKKATAGELRKALEAHLDETEQHVARLEQAFELMGMPARGKKCKGMQNLIAEGNEMITEAEDEDARDAVMIASAQKVEHYEIAGYGTARVWAKLLGKPEVASLLEESLNEEKAADKKLTGIAEGFVNQAAAQEGDEMETSRGRRGRTTRNGRQAAADTGRSAGRRRSR